MVKYIMEIMRNPKLKTIHQTPDMMKGHAMVGIPSDTTVSAGSSCEEKKIFQNIPAERVGSGQHFPPYPEHCWSQSGSLGRRSGQCLFPCCPAGEDNISKYPSRESEGLTRKGLTRKVAARNPAPMRAWKAMVNGL